MKLGIIGGVSPFAFSSFYNCLCEEYRKKTGYYPDILIYSIKVSIAEEQEFLQNKVSNKTMSSIKSEIKKACKIFKNNNIDTVTICCNTLSSIFCEIAKEYKFKNIITPVNSVSNYLKNNGRSLLLATGYTNNQMLYKNVLKISEEDQGVIEDFLREKINFNKSVINIDEILKKYEYDEIVLACTDINKNDLSVKKNVIDSNECLIKNVLQIIGD